MNFYNKLRYIDNSIGDNLLSNSILLMHLIKINHFYYTKNVFIFNLINRTLLKILFSNSTFNIVIEKSKYCLMCKQIFYAFISELFNTYHSSIYSISDCNDTFYNEIFLIINDIHKEVTSFSDKALNEFIEFFDQIETLISKSLKSLASCTIFDNSGVNADSLYGIYIRNIALQFHKLSFTQLSFLFNDYRIQVNLIADDNFANIKSSLRYYFPLNPTFTSFVELGQYYKSLQQIYVQNKSNNFHNGTTTDSANLFDICNAALHLFDLYSKFNYSRLSLFHLKEALRLAHESGFQVVSEICSNSYQIYVDLIYKDSEIVNCGNLLRESKLNSLNYIRISSSSYYSRYNLLFKCLILRCLYWEDFENFKLSGISSQLMLNITSPPILKSSINNTNTWKYLSNLELERSSNCIVFLAKELCFLGKYNDANSLLNEFQKIHHLSTFIQAQLSEIHLDIQVEISFLCNKICNYCTLVDSLTNVNQLLSEYRCVEKLIHLDDNLSLARKRLSILSESFRLEDKLTLRLLLLFSEINISSISPTNGLNSIFQFSTLEGKNRTFRAASIIQTSRCYLNMKKEHYAKQILLTNLLFIIQYSPQVLVGEAYFFLSNITILENIKLPGNDINEIENHNEYIIDLLKIALNIFLICNAEEKQSEVLIILACILNSFPHSYLDERNRIIRIFNVLTLYP